MNEMGRKLNWFAVELVLRGRAKRDNRQVRLDCVKRPFKYQSGSPVNEHDGQPIQNGWYVKKTAARSGRPRKANPETGQEEDQADKKDDRKFAECLHVGIMCCGSELSQDRSCGTSVSHQTTK
jgi:hypothetical protein